jgi:NADPH:quinone reductase-like Zn-dependent oxidoreductase
MLISILLAYLTGNNAIYWNSLKSSHNENFSDAFRLDNKMIWVFGGAGHLGRATVQMVNSAGAKVLCVDLETRAEEFVNSEKL